LTGKYSGSIKTTWYPSRAGIPRKVTFPWLFEICCKLLLRELLINKTQIRIGFVC
jgi:hypothetical protein